MDTEVGARCGTLVEPTTAFGPPAAGIGPYEEYPIVKRSPALIVALALLLLLLGACGGGGSESDGSADGPAASVTQGSEKISEKRPNCQQPR